MRIRIPGKLFIGGEYAVLYGAHAVLAPVERCMTFDCVAAQEDTFVSSMHGKLKLEKGQAVPETLLKAYRVALDYLSLLAVPKKHFIIVVKSDLAHEGQKLGLGSSGALIVGIIQSILGFHGVTPDKERLFKLSVLSQKAMADHASFADIAVAAYKSWILYRRFNLTVLKRLEASSLKTCLKMPWQGLRIQPFQPGRLYAFAVNSLTPASSKALVQAFTRSFDKAKDGFLIDSMDRLSLRLYNELASPMNVTAIVDALEQGYEKLMHAGRLNVKTAALDALIETIGTFHGSAKISGAGGGDCVLAFFEEETLYHDALEHFKHTQYPIIHLRRSQ
ncbi:MAG: mevalonate kinase [Candidatus Izemoplasmataceae bacterium]